MPGTCDGNPGQPCPTTQSEVDSPRAQLGSLPTTQSEVDSPRAQVGSLPTTQSEVDSQQARSLPTTQSEVDSPHGQAGTRINSSSKESQGLKTTLAIQVSKILPLEPNLQHFDYLRFQIKAAIGRKEQLSPTMWSEYNKVSNVIKQKLIQIVASCTNSHSSWLQEFKAKYQHHPQNKDYPLVLKTVCHHKHVSQKLLLREWKLELH